MVSAQHLYPKADYLADAVSYFWPILELHRQAVSLVIPLSFRPRIALLY